MSEHGFIKEWRDWLDASEPGPHTLKVRPLLVPDMLVWRSLHNVPFASRIEPHTALLAILQEGDTVDVTQVPGTWAERAIVAEECSYTLAARGADITAHLAMILDAKVWVGRGGSVHLPLSFNTPSTSPDYRAAVLVGSLGFHLFGYYPNREGILRARRVQNRPY